MIRVKNVANGLASVIANVKYYLKRINKAINKAIKISNNSKIIAEKAAIEAEIFVAKLAKIVAKIVAEKFAIEAKTVAKNSN